MPRTKRTQRIEEFQIDSNTHQHIQTLFSHCFPEYPRGRSYYKQVPTFRYLEWEEDQLIAHLGIDYRMINVAGQIVAIFGIVDLCVAESHQSQKIAAHLLQEAETLARQNQIDFLVLVSSEHDYYRKHGFALVQNTCRWLLISEHQTLGVGHRRIEESLMVKPLGAKQWSEGLVDFLGAIF